MNLPKVPKTVEYFHLATGTGYSIAAARVIIQLTVTIARQRYRQGVSIQLIF